MHILLLLAAGIFGAIIGSFLNVVIYRLPIMLERTWRAQCLEFLKQTAPNMRSKNRRFNLFYPRSHCPKCEHTIAFSHNIPIISYLVLGGQCSYCRAGISWRYPVVELLSMIATIWVFSHFGFTTMGLMAWILVLALLALSFIDIEHRLLPDDITMVLLWLGLLLSIFNVFVGSHDAIIGAVCGYTSLWIVGWLFKIIRKMEGIGHGDFKLLALLGAWLGWQMLVPIVLIASLIGASCGLIILLWNRYHRHTPLPFGPYLAIAGVMVLFYGQPLLTWYAQLLAF